MYDVYSRILDFYQDLDRPSFSLRRFLIEKIIIAIVLLGKSITHWEFPRRAAGGWWWIWRNRLEVIAG
jgi:hypothetical protein